MFGLWENEVIEVKKEDKKLWGFVGFFSIICCVFVCDKWSFC